MLIKHIEGADVILGAPSDWDGDEIPCGALPVRRVPVPGGQCMVSAWEPTPDEIDRMKSGETVKLWIFGTSHPVVALTVGEGNLEGVT